MTTFVLVHGAWLGAWCWSRVAKSLAAGQHDVVAPTLTGLGERSHLLNPEIDLETHILDVVNLMKWQELRDVVLVGHSYGGMVISGVAERMEKSIAGIVMLDAFFPADGQSVIDLQPQPVREALLQMARDGITAVPPRPAAMFNVNENDRAWVDAKCTPQPIKCFLQPSRLTGARDRIAKRTCIRAADFPSVPFDAGMAEARNKGWRTAEIAGGHALMLDAPAQLTELLVQLA
ncbi:MAG: esterase [Sphingomonas bacterium]|nr:esterase [Sphingomonas bacterium]